MLVGGIAAWTDTKITDWRDHWTIGWLDDGFDGGASVASFLFFFCGKLIIHHTIIILVTIIIMLFIPGCSHNI